MTGSDDARRAGDLLPREITRRLTTRAFGRRIYYLPDVDSTNRLAAALAQAGEAEGALVVADHQTTGKGRWDRRWESPAGKNLLFSVILRPGASPRAVLPVTLAFSTAVSEVLGAITGREVGVKWPNDVVCAGSKICGILAEAATSGERTVFVVVGVGVNVNVRLDEFPPDLADRACSCRTLTGRDRDRSEVLAHLLAAMEKAYTDFAEGGFGRLSAAYKSRLVILGRDVLVRGSRGDTVARVIDVAPDGGLVVETSGGEATLYDDEVTLVREKGD